MTRTMVEAVSPQALVGKAVLNAYFEKTKDQHNHPVLFVKTKHATFTIKHKRNCCERVREVIQDGDLLNLIGKKIIYRDTAEQPDREDMPDQFTKYESIQFVTGESEDVCVDWHVKSTGCYTRPRISVHKEWIHCIFTEA